MKTVAADDGYIVFQKFFSDLVKQETSVVMWQVTAGGERDVQRCMLVSWKYDSRILNFQSLEENPLPLIEAPIFVYAEDAGVIFKTDSRGGDKPTLSLHLPAQINYLEEPDIYIIKGTAGVDLSNAPWRVRSLQARQTDHQEKIDPSVSLKEEEKLFADKREAPRVRPKDDKIITCQRVGVPEMSESFLLFDLSRGGLGFKVVVQDLFERGQFIEITALEGQTLDAPLFGEVMSVRDLAPEDVGWKVGIRFVDEVPKT